ncbi:MAG: clostripain-related cysteine peptidase [Clostridia bacterium]|nr:clostripain-related cysteine peptidase [Clostridia bacterium]
MDQNQRPHSREKKVGSGSVDVHVNHSVGSSGPVGSGGRKPSSSSGRASSPIPVFGGSGRKLSLKKILIIAAIVLVVLFVFKKMGGGMLTDIGDPSAHVNNVGTSSTDSASYASYSKPDYTVSKLARAKKYTPVGNGQDTVTVMVYMCGTDLESKYGMATKDLKEMLSAQISDKVNVIVETGGCKQWKNSSISSSKNQIFKVQTGGLKILEKDAGTAAMTDPQNLTSFIKYCDKKFPADRNILILWDHGGGSLAGYGYDEKHPSASSMPLSKMNAALKAANVNFDFIGFDACLMATLETALVCGNYADYLIGSEETEPGTGWYYKNWLTQLSNNTSISTVDLGKTIIDDYQAACASQAGATITLSLTDLAEMAGTIPEAFRDFSTSTNKLISSDDYKKVSDARAGVRQFSAQNKINQIDLADFAQRVGTKEAKALENAIHGCVKYNRSTTSRCNGLSIFFPYETTSNVKNAVSSFEAIGIDDEYTKCIKSFASLEYGGQIAGSASQIPDLSSMGGDLLGSLIQSYVGGGSTSTSPLASLAGAMLGGGSTSSSQSSPLGSLAGSLLTGALSNAAGGSSSQSSSSSSSPLGSLAGSILGGLGGSSSSSSGGLDVGSLASLLTGFAGRSMPAELDWVDTDLIAENAKDIAKNCINPARIVATEKNGKKVLELEDSEWNLIQTVELNVFVKEGNGYIDMGLDNTFEWADDNSIALDFDGTWLTLNNKACAYYLVSDTQQADGSWKTIGRIPARLNGQFVNLQVVFDKANPDGVVTGAYPLYEDAEIDVQAKGNIEIKAGDKIELLCDYYGLDGNYSETYTLGTTITVPQSGLSLVNLKLNSSDVSATYRVTDIYGNSYWVSAD